MTDAPERIMAWNHSTELSWFGSWATTRYPEESTEYTRADLAKPRVKPLVWEGPCQENNWIYVARSPWGDYGIHIDGGRHRSWLEAHEKPYERWIGDNDVGSVFEAQAAAQADYEARVLACLE